MDSLYVGFALGLFAGAMVWNEKIRKQVYAFIGKKKTEIKETDQ